MRQREASAALVVAVAIAIPLVAAGCGGTSDGGASVVSPSLPTTDHPEGTGLDARLEGRLEGRADTGCVWLVPDEADLPGGRVATVWPRGFTALWDPLRLMRRDGELVATEGDVLLTGGGLVPMSPPVPPVPEPCRTGDRVWMVSKVQEVS